MADSNVLPESRIMKFTLTNTIWIAATAAFALSGFLAAQTEERFDYQVRNDFFAGFAGDAKALERGLAKTGKILSENPRHAEAMVWHGSALFFQSGQAFRNGDQAKGMELYGKGIGMMKQAVAMEPDNLAVRIPRGATLLTASRTMPPPMAEELREDGLSDYLAVFQAQKNQLAELGEHSRGELLLGIADAYARKNNPQKAEEFFSLIVELMPEKSIYRKSATTWLGNRQLLPVNLAGCLGCHTGK